MTTPHAPGAVSGDRSRAATLLVVGVVAALGGGIPLLDTYVDDADASPTGAVITVVPDSANLPQSVSLVPASGWRRGGSATSSSLVSSAASLSIRLTSAPSSDDCPRVRREAEEAFLEEASVAPAGTGTRLATADGVTGRLSSYSSGLVDGLVFVACHDGVAVVVTAAASAGSSAALGEVVGMLGSVRFR